jgi:hypothetical protein
MGCQNQNGIYKVFNDQKSFSEKGDSGAIVFLLIPETFRFEPNKLFPVGLIVSGDVDKKLSNFIALEDLFRHFCSKQSIDGLGKTLDITFKNPKLDGMIKFSPSLLIFNKRSLLIGKSYF